MSYPSLLRRSWAALLALLVGSGLWSVHTLSFGPLAARYRTQLTQAGEIGASLDPRLAAAPLPPRVIDLLRINSVAAADAGGLSQSGFLATDLVRRVSEKAVACGIDVAASKPGTGSQTATTLEVRAELRLRGSYQQVVRLLDDLASEGTFYRVEELSVVPLSGGIVQADLQLARMLLKRGAAVR